MSYSIPVRSCLLREREMQEFYLAHPHYQDLDFSEQILGDFNISYSTRQVEKERPPNQGEMVIIANHPIGSCDALIKLVSEVRQDSKVLLSFTSLKLKPLNN